MKKKALEAEIAGILREFAEAIAEATASGRRGRATYVLKDLERAAELGKRRKR